MGCRWVTEATAKAHLERRVMLPGASCAEMPRDFPEPAKANWRATRGYRWLRVTGVAKRYSRHRDAKFVGCCLTDFA